MEWHKNNDGEKTHTKLVTENDKRKRNQSRDLGKDDSINQN